RRDLWSPLGDEALLRNPTDCSVGRNRPEYSRDVTATASSEIERVSRAGVGAAVAERNPPKARDHDRVAGRIVQKSFECASPCVERGDLAAGGVSDEQHIAECAEIGGGDREAPRFAEGTVGGAAFEVSIRIEGSDEASRDAVEVS